MVPRQAANISVTNIEVVQISGFAFPILYLAVDDRFLPNENRCCPRALIRPLDSGLGDCSPRLASSVAYPDSYR